MTTVPILNSGDVVALYGDADTISNLTVSSPFSTINVAGTGTDAQLRPVGSTGGVETVPITAEVGVTAQGFDGDDLRGVRSVAESTGALALLLTGSGVGWIVPSSVFDLPGSQSDTQWPNADVVRTSITFAPTDTPQIVDSITTIDSNSSITVPALSGRTVWLALTIAGSVKGAARKVGVYETTITAGTAAISAARGYLLLAKPLKAEGVT